jgi:hypothetical protein
MFTGIKVTAADYSSIFEKTGCRTAVGWHRPAGSVVFVLNPFRNVTKHVVKPEWVWSEAPDWGGVRKSVFALDGNHEP